MAEGVVFSAKENAAYFINAQISMNKAFRGPFDENADMTKYNKTVDAAGKAINDSMDAYLEVGRRMNKGFREMKGWWKYFD